MKEQLKLRVWWIPQVPMKPFYVEVGNFEEANLLLETLAMYDEFQFKNKVKPDYSNIGGLESFDPESKDWIDWYDEETGDSFYEYRINTGFKKIVFPKS